MPNPRFRVLLVVLALTSGCATGTPALWRAGASRVGHEGTPVGAPRPLERVAVYFKGGFGPFEEVESQRVYLCGTTTVLRKAFVLDPQGAPTGEPERDYEVVADVTTEEFPRDERASFLRGDELFSVLGVGNDAFDLFEVSLDPAFREDALRRLRFYAAGLGADAVIDVFATGEAEHHMHVGERVGLDPASTTSPFYVDLRLLGLRLRDVRLHGRAVRFE